MAVAARATKKSKLKKPTRETFDREMELTEHLGELRSRIIRSILYVAAAMVVTWFQYGRIYHLLKQPVEHIRLQTEWSYVFTSLLEPFMVRLQVSAVAAVILAFPLLMMELWGFVAPALTRSERRAVYLVGPLSVALFASGVATTLLVLPAGVRWFLSFLPPDTKLLQRVPDYVLFLVKTCLAFGIVFQLPVMLLFLGRVGLVNSRFLVRYWRQAVVVCAAAAAVITPSADAFTMVALAAPLGVLYAVSILLVRLVERRPAADDVSED